MTEFLVLVALMLALEAAITVAGRRVDATRFFGRRGLPRGTYRGDLFRPAEPMVDFASDCVARAHTRLGGTQLPNL